MKKETKVDEKEKNLNAKTDETNKMPLKKKIWRTIWVALAICGFFAVIFVALYYTGAWDFLKNREKVQTWIASLGFWGLFIFVALQFLQVTFLPLPSTITTLAGVYVFGPLRAALLSLAGVILGSAFAFFLGRVFGKKLVEFMVGKETCEKWTKFLTDAKYSFFVMMVLPVFPDDVLCLVAGLTDMSWTFFVVTNLISRPIGIFMTCYLGSGELIPYHGWGIGVWAVIVVVVAVLIYLSYRYRDQIENFMRKTFRTKKQKLEQQSTNGPFEVEVKALKKQDEKDLKVSNKNSLNEKPEKTKPPETKKQKEEENSKKNSRK